MCVYSICVWVCVCIVYVWTALLYAVGHEISETFFSLAKSNHFLPALVTDIAWMACVYVCVCVWGVCMWSVCVCGVCVWGCLNCLLPESYLALAKRPRQSQRGKNKRPTSKTNFCTHSWIHAMVCVRVRVYVCLCAILFLCLCVSLCWLVCVRICVFTSQWRHRISSATRFAQKKNTKLGNLNHKCRVRVCVCICVWVWVKVCVFFGRACLLSHTHT